MDKKCIPSYLKASTSYNYINEIKLPTKLNKNDSNIRLRVNNDGLRITCNGNYRYIFLTLFKTKKKS